MLREQQREPRVCVDGVIYLAFRIKSCVLPLQTKALPRPLCAGWGVWRLVSGVGNGKRWFSAGRCDCRELVKPARVQGQQATGAARSWLGGKRTLQSPERAQSGEAGEGRGPAARRASCQQQRVCGRGRGVTLPKPFTEGELGEREMGKHLGSQAGVLESMWGSR